MLLHDPQSTGAELVDEARSWTWDPIEHACDRWVAAQITQLAEEVHKLLNALAANHDVNAAIRRNVLLHRLPLVMSVHRRILYDSETRLWDLVSDAMGAEWRQCQASALGLDGATLENSARAALQLYRVAANESSAVLSDDQRGVVTHTLARLVP
jgi:hypothetical protein